MTDVRVVVFDIDDTLYLERDYVRSGFFAVGAWLVDKYGIADFAQRAWQCFEMGTRGTIFDQALRLAGLAPEPDLIRKMVCIYREHEPQIVLAADARKCLAALRQSGLSLAAVSDGPLDSQQAKCRALALSQWLDPILLTAAWGDAFAKPHPRAFAAIESTFSLSGENCVYVGDNPRKDFRAPSERGWQTIRIRRPGGLHRDIPSGSDVQWERPDLSDMPTMLRDRP